MKISFVSSNEHDRESGLSAHEVRLHDAQLAGWMSVDKVRRFANLYSYGWDPVNGADLDGNNALHINESGDFLFEKIDENLYKRYKIIDKAIALSEGTEKTLDLTRN